MSEGLRTVRKAMLRLENQHEWLEFTVLSCTLSCYRSDEEANLQGRILDGNIER